MNEGRPKACIAQRVVDAFGKRICERKFEQSPGRGAKGSRASQAAYSRDAAKSGWACIDAEQCNVSA